jgi:molybdenum cofactor sulfurtransferase
MTTAQSTGVKPGAAPREAEFHEFLKSNPEYEQTRFLDELRDREYARLDQGNHVYLDYTGGGLYAQSQVDAHRDLLLSSVFGNPHSVNPSSLAMTRRVASVRKRVLEFFNASTVD